MSYEFTHPDRLAVEIRRVATERLDHALGELSEGLSKDPAAAVHAARKDLKKTRSLMRLAKDSLGEDRFRTENGRLRDAAHMLASAREADAQGEALDSLLEHFEGRVTPGARSAAWEWRTGMSRSDGAADVLRSAAEASSLIRHARDDARLWRLGHGGFGLIEPGLRRTYRQGRKGLAGAVEDPSDETVHEWRKRVKDMWYSLRLLGNSWEPVMGTLADQAHALSELLGDHHDLGEVRAAIEAGDAGLAAGPRAELSALARSRQDEFYRAAISLGRRLYSEGSRRYVARLEGVWRAWEADPSRQLAQEGLPSS